MYDLGMRLEYCLKINTLDSFISPKDSQFNQSPMSSSDLCPCLYDVISNNNNCNRILILLVQLPNSSSKTSLLWCSNHNCRHFIGINQWKHSGNYGDLPTGSNCTQHKTFFNIQGNKDASKFTWNDCESCRLLWVVSHYSIVHSLR